MMNKEEMKLTILMGLCVFFVTLFSALYIINTENIRENKTMIKELKDAFGELEDKLTNKIYHCNDCTEFFDFPDKLVFADPNIDINSIGKKTMTIAEHIQEIEDNFHVLDMKYKDV